jgi:hypothetical protein
MAQSVDHSDRELRGQGRLDSRVCLIGACLAHERVRQLDHLAPDAFRQHLPDQLEVLAGQSAVTVVFQCRSNAVETLKRCLCQTNLLPDTEQLPAEIDGVDRRLLAILLPGGLRLSL